MILYREDLDAQECGHPSHTKGEEECFLLLTARCHPGKGMDVGYDKLTGRVCARCHECAQPICSVQVARRVDVSRN